jgi:LmbE family N-acetylglucosaminyl deacetylase
MPQVYREQSPLQEQERAQASLVAELLCRNGRARTIQTATPPGYSYERLEPRLPVACEVDGPIVQVAAHPGDGPDFFYATYLQMASRAQYCPEYHEILLTDGEQGVNGWPPEHTRQVRIAEAARGAGLVGSRLHFLGYPDGGLPSLGGTRRERLIRELADLIGQIEPGILIVHPAKNDHPDHAHTFLLTAAALQRITYAGRRAPTLLIHDVEFGLQQKSLWTQAAGDHRLHTYPMHSPDLIVDISATHHLAQQALHQHQTQMYDPLDGQPKIYADLIDVLARVRGLQCMTRGRERPAHGQGFSQIVLPGLTSTHNAFMQRLPAQCLYQRVKHTPLG